METVIKLAKKVRKKEMLLARWHSLHVHNRGSSVVVVKSVSLSATSLQVFTLMRSRRVYIEE